MSRAGCFLPQVDGAADSSDISDPPASGRQNGSAGPITDARAALSAVLNLAPEAALGATVATSRVASFDGKRAALDSANTAGPVSAAPGGHAGFEALDGKEVAPVSTGPHSVSELETDDGNEAGPVSTGPHNVAEIKTDDGTEAGPVSTGPHNVAELETDDAIEAGPVSTGPRHHEGLKLDDGNGVGPLSMGPVDRAGHETDNATGVGPVSPGPHDCGGHVEDGSRGGLALRPNSFTEGGPARGAPSERTGHLPGHNAHFGGEMSDAVPAHGNASAAFMPKQGVEDINVRETRISEPGTHSKVLPALPKGGDSSLVQDAGGEQLPPGAAVSVQAGGETPGGAVPHGADAVDGPGARGSPTGEDRKRAPVWAGVDPGDEGTREGEGHDAYPPADVDSLDEGTCEGEQHDAQPPAALSQWEREGLPVLAVSLRRMLGSAEGRRAVPALVADPEVG
jgi:hypothetical protein